MKKLILMRGLPGSGKSTFANELAVENAVICSADYYFYQDGIYHFDKYLLGAAHNFCKMEVNGCMANSVGCIIVDNCNLKSSDRKPYIDMAAKYGYEVEIIEPTTAWKDDEVECCAHTIHCVPLDTIQRMKINRN